MWKACNLMTKVIEKIESRPKSEKELRNMKQGISQIFNSVFICNMKEKANIEL